MSLVGAENAFKLQETEIFGIGTVDVRVNDRTALDYEARENKMFNFSVSEMI